jgi:hypothetical protein
MRGPLVIFIFIPLTPIPFHHPLHMCRPSRRGGRGEPRPQLPGARPSLPCVPTAASVGEALPCIVSRTRPMQRLHGDETLLARSPSSARVAAVEHQHTLESVSCHPLLRNSISRHTPLFHSRQPRWSISMQNQSNT